MATPTEQDVTIYYQADETLSGTVTDDEGSGVDLTAGGSVDLEFEIATEYGATPVLTKDLAVGITGEADGDYSAVIADTDWDSLPISGTFRIYYYTLWYTDAAGVRVPKARGQLTVSGTVSS